MQLTWIEIFLRLIPENLIILYGIYVISKKIFNIRGYIISVMILALCGFYVRSLPINLGVHMIINIILTIAVVYINGVSIIKAINNTLILYLLINICEFMNMALLNMLNINIESLSSVMKDLLGLPSLMILLIFIMIAKYNLKKKEGVINVLS